MDKEGNELGTNQRGEIVIQGASVFRGYENNPEANARALVNGWFRTGDEGYLDDDCYLHLTGRIKDIIIRGGENIAPHEVDEVLLQASRGRRCSHLRLRASHAGRRSGGCRRPARTERRHRICAI